MKKLLLLLLCVPLMFSCGNNSDNDRWTTEITKEMLEDGYTGKGTLYLTYSDERDFYNDGNKFIEISYQNGKKHGKASNWHRNGQVSWERYFNEDQLDGNSIRFDAESNVVQHVIYKMGQIEKAIK
ncbi:MAG: hypothetical protein HN996_10775 [Opitutae bacterium]|nr:hypothetical protein [Opitutae bacterium]